MIYVCLHILHPHRKKKKKEKEKKYKKLLELNFIPYAKITLKIVN